MGRTSGTLWKEKIPGWHGRSEKKLLNLKWKATCKWRDMPLWDSWYWGTHKNKQTTKNKITQRRVIGSNASGKKAQGKDSSAISSQTKYHMGSRPWKTITDVDTRAFMGHNALQQDTRGLARHRQGREVES
jgi:hypothetical protein